ncbi:mitochondrial Band 7 stomatin-like domain-containing protein [Andalucia godoyi]|uniref:Mitochondrial Band 7 stomatin-like domain-containing protein n=1 Tax=Andalucia godoyi TaxID=505711 RepID=A0A8K0F161_ANDGO|nr:mitochondrial Band 7 stomatin-like domain-containing protein [Andalucia godoyi]|eukprot:ANDGO_00188.mRNA.1 mitochondrial Band 7 stomatin-like domain-containing protein
MLALRRVSRRLLSGTVPNPINTVVNVVPQGETWVIERLGSYNRTLTAGLHVVVPILERIAYAHSLKEMAFEVPSQSAFTLDNVHLHIDGVVFVRVMDAQKASYEVQDPMYSIVQLAQTTMRSEIGKISLDRTFAERDSLNHAIVHALEKVAHGWGIAVTRYEIRDIQVPQSIRVAMDLEAEAERKKRKQILESEGDMTAARNVAEGQKSASVLMSEAAATESINHARGEAEALLARAAATAKSIELVGNALNLPGAREAVAKGLAEEYIAAFSQIAKKGNTIIVPENVADVSSVVSRAWGLLQGLSANSAITTDSFSPAPATAAGGSPSSSSTSRSSTPGKNL